MGVEAAHLGSLGEGIGDGGGLSAGQRPHEQVFLYSKGYRSLILPMSGKTASFTIVGMPIFGRRLRVEGVENRAGGSVAGVEVHPGLIVKIATWMLDPAACADVELGAPRASLAALSSLHDLLAAQGLRRTFPGDRTVVEEKGDEVLAATTGPSDRTVPTDPGAGRAEATAVERGATRRGTRGAGRFRCAPIRHRTRHHLDGKL